MVEFDGIRVPRVLVTELAHQLVYRDKLATASNLLACLASGKPGITLNEHDRNVVREVLETPPAGLEMLRDALSGNTRAVPVEGRRGREHADHT